MQGSLSRRGFGLGLAAMTTAATAHAEEPLRLRCSLDTAPTHMRNISVADYLKQVEAGSGGRIRTELFSSGQLYADLNVSKALLQGQVEMAVPGTWTLTGFVPDFDMFQLPALYGQPFEVSHRAIDGRAGAFLARQVEAKLRVHVLGRWFDLGYENLYASKKPLRTIEDIRGLKIRSPGGAGVAWRLHTLGAIPNTTAWPDVAMALSQGTFDGLVTTDQSLAAAQFWDVGVKYSLADRGFIGEYIPLVSQAFWARLAPDLQRLMTDLWDGHIAEYRRATLASQVQARQTMEAHGISFVDPTAEELAATRRTLVASQDALIHDSNLSKEIVALATEDVGKLG